jgi:hypothetical protein
MKHECNCCGSERVVYVCCPHGTQVGAPPAQPQTPPPTTPSPTPTETPTEPRPQPVCSMARVRIDSIRVGVSGAEADPGAAAKWFLTIVVNGQSRVFINEDVRDNRDFPVGFDFAVELVNENTTIRIGSSGFEEDIFGDDLLPSAEQTHGSHDNWGIGGMRTLSAANSEFTYTIFYTVTCLQSLARSVISRSEAVSLVQNRLASMGFADSRTDDEALTVFIRRLSARGLELKQVDSNLLVWEGAESVNRLAPSVFSSTSRRNQREASSKRSSKR